MFDPIDNDLQAAANALRDVIAPAVDPANPIAQQQLKLIVDWLEFYRQRAPQWWRLDAFELSQQAAMARELAGVLPAAQQGGLAAALQGAAEVEHALGVGPQRVRHAVTELEDAISERVRASAALPPEQRRQVERIVVGGTKRWLDAHRAWYAPLSIESDPAALPALDVALQPMVPPDTTSPETPKATEEP